MKRAKVVTGICSLILLYFPACGKRLERPAKDAIRKFDSAGLTRDEIEVLSIQESGSVALAEVQVKTAFKLKKAAGGEWVIDEIRLGSGRWESAEHILACLKKERTETTGSQLESVASGIRRFEQAQGHLPDVENFDSLIDLLVPDYLETVIRLDGWSRVFRYENLSDSQFDLRSAGPDGEFHTSDDLVAESP